MKSLVVLAALCAGTALFAAPESANAGHYPRSGGYGSGGYGSGGYGSGGYGSGGYGYGSGGSSYGRGYGAHDSHYGHQSGHRSRGYGYGHRYIDPYHGQRLRHQAHHHYDFILGSQGFGFRYGR